MNVVESLFDGNTYMTSTVPEQKKKRVTNLQIVMNNGIAVICEMFRVEKDNLFDGDKGYDINFRTLCGEVLQFEDVNHLCSLDSVVEELGLGDIDIYDFSVQDMILQYVENKYREKTNKTNYVAS